MATKRSSTVVSSFSNIFDVGSLFFHVLPPYSSKNEIDFVDLVDIKL